VYTVDASFYLAVDDFRGCGIEQQTAAHAYRVAQGSRRQTDTGAHTDWAESLRVLAHRGGATEQSVTWPDNGANCGCAWDRTEASREATDIEEHSIGGARPQRKSAEWERPGAGTADRIR
jgi:hypothetical protein